MKLNSQYTIFTGILEMRPSAIKEDNLKKYYHPWEERLFNGAYKATLEHLRDNYYDSFLLGMLPNLLDQNTKDNPKYLRRYTRKELNHGQFKTVFKEQDFVLNAEYFDLYFFPNGLAIFFFKLEFLELPSLDIIPEMIYQMRNLSSTLLLDEGEISLEKWIEEQLADVVTLNKNWSNYIPQLKSYNILDINEELNISQMDHLLYDLATLSPLGTAASNSGNAPSEEYFSDLMKKHKISVFKNWSALSLFDTFTMISFNKPDPHRVWEYDYFNVYLMAIYLKGFIFLANTTLSDVTVADRKSELIKNTFIEFINDYYISNISYRFLPNILNEKMVYGLDIPVEMNKMYSNINRLNLTIKEDRDIILNITILTLAIFSIFSVITDLSDWLSISMESKSWLYPNAGLIALVVLVIALLLAFNYHKLRKND